MTAIWVALVSKKGRETQACGASQARKAPQVNKLQHLQEAKQLKQTNWGIHEKQVEEAKQIKKLKQRLGKTTVHYMLWIINQYY